MSIRFAISFILLILLSAGCNPSKKLVKDAQAYEEAEMTGQSFERYRQAYIANPKNVNAHVGLKKTGQQLLLNHLQKVKSAMSAGDFDLANEHLEKANYLTEFASLYKVKLEIPVSFSGLSEQIERKWIETAEAEAYDLLLNEEYEKAIEKAEEIKSLDPGNKEAEYLTLLAKIYPKYNEGKKAYELGLYRSAYFAFDEVVKIDADFKDALQLRDESQKKEQFTMAYVPVHHQGVATAFEMSLAAEIKQSILSLDDPFMILLNRDNMEKLLEEQKKNMEAIFGEKQIIEAGKLIGAQYILTGEIVNFQNELSPKIVETKKGYLGANRLSKKVTYSEVKQMLNVNIQYRFELMNTQTGRVYLADNVTFSHRGEVHYAEYDGNYMEVYAGDWKLPVLITPMDQIYNSPAEKNQLNALFNAEKNLPSKAEMNRQAMQKIATKVKESLKEFKAVVR